MIFLLHKLSWKVIYFFACCLLIFLLLFGLTINVLSIKNALKFSNINNNLASIYSKFNKNNVRSNFTSIYDLNKLPFGKNLIGIEKKGEYLPTNSKLYCASIDKYGDIALGFENMFVVFSYSTNYSSAIKGSFPIGDKGNEGSYNEHVIVNDVKDLKNASIYTSVSGTNSLIGKDFIPSSASFDNNGDLLFSYTSNGNFETTKITGLIYVPYTPQFDGLTNPVLYPQTQKINYGIDVINGKTTGTTDPNHDSNYEIFLYYSNNDGQYYWERNNGAFNVWKNTQFPIIEKVERISSAQLSYDGNYIIFSSSRAGSRSNLERRSLWDGSDSKPASAGLPLTFMMKMQVDNDYDVNKNKYVAGKGKQADPSDPSKKNVKLNNSGFFVSKIFPIYYQPEWDSHNFAFIHNYSAINRDGYVALSGDVYWNGYGNVNPIRISKQSISELYKLNENESNTIINKQFQVGSYNVIALNSTFDKPIKRFTDHSNYITTNANSDTFYCLNGADNQGFKTDEDSRDVNQRSYSFGLSIVTNNGAGDKYDTSNSNYNSLYFGIQANEDFMEENQYFNDLTVAGNNSMGVSFSDALNLPGSIFLVNNNSNFAFTWGTHKNVNVSNGIYNINKKMTFNNENIPVVPNSTINTDPNEQMGGNLLIKFNKFNSITDSDSDVLLSTCENLNGGGYVFLHHDINDPKPPKLNTYSINIQKAIPVDPFSPLNPSNIIKKNNSQKELIAIFVPLIIIFFTICIIASVILIIYFKKRKKLNIK